MKQILTFAFIIAYLAYYIFQIWIFRFLTYNESIRDFKLGQCIKLRSVLMIIVSTYAAIFISIMIPNPDIANRFLHGFVGGFMVYVFYILAYRDSKVLIDWKIVLLIGILTVSTLGVINELAEAIIQFSANIIFNSSIFDTWYDLISNTIGITLAAVLVAVFRKKLL